MEHITNSPIPSGKPIHVPLQPVTTGIQSTPPQGTPLPKPQS